MEAHRPRASVLDLLPLVGLAVLALLALAWIDVLPGGWRLRRWLDPARQAREDARHAAERLAIFASGNASAPPGSIVFVGSSTIERFPLERAFPGRTCLNRGIANASAATLLGNLSGLLPSAPPAGIVLYAGAVDWRASGRDARVAAGRIEALVAGIRHALPDVPIALIGILPERALSADALARLREVDETLAALSRQLGIAYVATARPPLAAASGALAEDVSVDAFHLDEEGYAALARWIVEDGGDVGRLLAP